MCRIWYLALLTMPVVLATLYQIQPTIFRTFTPSSLLFSRLSWLTIRTMSTFQHPTYNIPITLPPDLSQDQLLNFHPFTVSYFLRPPSTICKN